MVRRGRTAAVVAGVALAAAACGGSGGSDAKGATSSPPGVEVSGRDAAAQAAKQPILLAFGGDTHFEGQLRGPGWGTRPRRSARSPGSCARRISPWSTWRRPSRRAAPRRPGRSSRSGRRRPR
ncbi:hypothetical protein [Actinomadura madurae]|uniref:hypothetical protein n=1 Tax=Actinomadura madurae TaxID=1993 RepID=UPI0027E340AB|nr:hypothetical protein [Actinomadura madurae]